MEMSLSIPLLVEAIDPVAEQRLTGLDSALVSGRALNHEDGFAINTSTAAPLTSVTAMMASSLPMDYRADITVDQLSDETMSEVMASQDPAERRRLVMGADPAHQVQKLTRTASEIYQENLQLAVGPGADQSLFVEQILQARDVKFSGFSPLQPSPIPFLAADWRNANSKEGAFSEMPSSVVDTGYRRLTTQPRTDLSTFVTFGVVGVYDPAKVSQGGSRLNDVPLETYRSSAVTGANESSREALGDEPMRSDLSPTGYLQAPPALLVPLKALPAFWKSFNGLDKAAPISSVRVRVANVHGLDAAGRERIRIIADRIHALTGLDVDITIGASLENRKVALPASAAGTPPLLLNEQWTKKGVAVKISQALDVKSLVLFVLILVSTSLTIALITAASVASRRRELGTLSAIGWTTAQIGRLLFTELIVIGLVAGIAGAVAAMPVAAALRIELSWWQIALAVPLGIALALVPGYLAVLSVGRASPADAFRTTTGRASRTRIALSGAASLALAFAIRRRGRQRRVRRCLRQEHPPNDEDRRAIRSHLRGRGIKAVIPGPRDQQAQPQTPRITRRQTHPARRRRL